MKSQMKNLLIIVALIVSVGALIDCNRPCGAPGPGMRRGGGPGMSGVELNDAQIKAYDELRRQQPGVNRRQLRMAAYLGLDKTQLEKFLKAHSVMEDKMDALQRDRDASPEKRREAMWRIHSETRDEVRALLTDGQKELFDKAHPAGGRGPGFGPGFGPGGPGPGCCGG